MNIAFQGTYGAYSEQAVKAYFGTHCHTTPCEHFDEVFDKVAHSECDFGMVPVENSLAGSIHRNYDLLLRHQLHIVGEEILRINHQLIALPNVSLTDIKRVYSHWQALDQCEQQLQRLLPNAEKIQTFDTAGSVRLLLDEQRTDTAAIASRQAAELYQLPILHASIEDDPTNYTRFVALSRYPYLTLSNDISYKTSLVFAAPNVPGALFKALAAFSLRDIDLTKIESRPLQGSPFKYLFYLDFLGNATDTPIVHAIQHLKELATLVRILGCYPQADHTVLR
ncbi:MAG TPA: prephenate dehydratase [Chitinophagales bacterium]|jgi:prephenate dehydratase|nr:prephenate dehydratase [Chitinophagales bacterium]